MNSSHRSIKNANPYEKTVLKAIFIFSAFPVLLILLLFYGLFSDLIYTYISSELGNTFMDRFLLFVNLILIYYVIFARMVFRFVNRIFGPYSRILKELDDILAGERHQLLFLRKDDYGQELIDRINALIEKLSK